MPSFLRSAANAIGQLASFRVMLALVTSSAVTASVAGPLAYQALAARDGTETARIAAERPPGPPPGSGGSSTTIAPAPNDQFEPELAVTSVAGDPTEDPDDTSSGGSASSTIPGARPGSTLPGRTGTTRPPGAGSIVPVRPGGSPAGTTSPTGGATTTTAPAKPPTIGVSVSSSPDRSEANPLDGARITGLAYVFVDLKNARNVTWYLDGTPPNAKSFSSDLAPPLDLISGPNEPVAGGNDPALPLDTAKVLGPGAHALLAVVGLADGTELFLLCDFDVLA